MPIPLSKRRHGRLLATGPYSGQVQILLCTEVLAVANII